jgi:hypothetical protein
MLDVMVTGRLIVLSAILTLSLSAATYADGDGQNQQSQEKTPPDSTAKQPAPPLFPKYRRGVYRNGQGVEFVDAVPQSPPLETDDPGVPDKGAYEINLSVDGDLFSEGQRVDLLFVDANYGILPAIRGHELPTQLKVEFPVAAFRTDGEPFAVGIGPVKVGVKFNFHNNEQKGLAVSFYPQMKFAAPGTEGVEKGLAEPGQIVLLPLLVSKEFHAFSFVFNGAVEKPVHDPDHEATAIIGAAVGRAITRKFAAMVEVRGESTFDLARDRLVFVNLGLVRGIRNIVVYAHVGRSVFSDDGFGHLFVGAGLKLLIQPKDKR